ncbi:hypothetical protein CI102_3757 [Trichoderma harzianum]|nr:hypothetical protein CI102_3757 [Trichoderma harzianum]
MCGRAWQRLSPLTLSGSQRSQRTGHSETKRQSELAWRQDRNGRAGSVTRRGRVHSSIACGPCAPKASCHCKESLRGLQKATDTVLHRGEWRAASIQGLVLLGLVTLPKVGGDGWGGESNSLIDLFFLFPLFSLLQRSISTGTTLKKAAWPPNFASADPVLSCLPHVR